MTAHKGRECPKCRGKRCTANNCTNPRYIYNRDLKCGCKKEEIIYKNRFTDTHCCKCKKSFCIYKLDNKYQCSTCRKGKAKQQINTNNGNQWKSTNGIDSQESVQQWNEFMEQEQNQPNTSYTQAVKQSPRNIYYSNCQNCGKTNKKSKGHMQYFEGPLCHKCNIQKENFKRYGTTGRITSCEICGLESDTQQNMERGNRQVYFCEMRCQMIYLACEKANNEEDLIEKLKDLALSKKYSSYPNCNMFGYEGSEDEWQQAKDDARYYYKNGTKKQEALRTFEENQPIVAEISQGIFPTEIREIIAKEASKPEPIISNTFELKDEYHDYEMALEEFDDILTMSNDHDPLFQITQARPITPKNDEFYKQQWGEFYTEQNEIPIMESEFDTQSIETVIQWKNTNNGEDNIQLQTNNDQLVNDLQSIGISTITVEENIPTPMIIEPIIPQTQIQVQTPELPKHEFINRKTARRASMSDIQLNSQQRQVKEIINNYDQMVLEMVNNYNDQIYQIMWNNTNTVESMNLYVNDLEKRFNNLNNKEEKFDELTNVQTTQINELEQIVEKLTQLNKERETVIKDQQQNIDILEKSINNYRIEQIYYEQWKETIDKKEDNNNFIIKGLQIKINDYEERLVNYSKMVKELQELKETINRQEAYITNLKYDEGKLKEERLTLKNNLEKLMQELQEMKNHQPIMEISQKSNEEIPIMESGEESQTNEEIPANDPIMDEKSLKGDVPIMEVYNKKPNKKSKKRKRMEIIPEIVKKIVRRKK